MKAWLVVNGFLQNRKFQEIHQWLCRAGEKKGVQISIKTNQELLGWCSEQGLRVLGEEREVDFVLFWDKDIRLAKILESKGFFVINSSKAIENCDDKGLTHLLLAKEGIPMPDTILAPMTFPNVGYTEKEFIKCVIEKLGLPLVIKENYGSFGQQVYLCENSQEVIQKVKELERTSFLFQRFIKETKGRDVRLQVVGDKVVAGMERFAKEGDFRANITNGGIMRKYESSKEEEELAVLVCKILGVDFAGVDLLFKADDSPLVCEVNSNGHFKNIYDCTGVNVAEKIMDYIMHKLALREVERL